jgi:hypothetical protein
MWNTNISLSAESNRPARTFVCDEKDNYGFLLWCTGPVFADILAILTVVSKILLASIRSFYYHLRYNLM